MIKQITCAINKLFVIIKRLPTKLDMADILYIGQFTFLFFVLVLRYLIRWHWFLQRKKERVAYLHHSFLFHFLRLEGRKTMLLSYFMRLTVYSFTLSLSQNLTISVVSYMQDVRNICILIRFTVLLENYQLPLFMTLFSVYKEQGYILTNAILWIGA